MAPQKMLYIKDEDVGLISKAQECSKENFSNTVIRALKFYVYSQEDADVDLQKLLIGFDPSVFEIDAVRYFLDRNDLKDFEEVLEDLWLDIENLYIEDFDEDWSYDDLVCEMVWRYLYATLNETQITFFGKELASSKSECLGVYNLHGIEISKNLIKKSLFQEYDEPPTIERVSMKPLVDDDEPSKAPDSLWFGDISASFKVFRTRGGKFLIWATTNSGDLNCSSNVDCGLIVPGVSDYAILENLNDDLETIKTTNFGIEFELPKGLIRRAKDAFRREVPIKHLDI